MGYSVKMSECWGPSHSLKFADWRVKPDGDGDLLPRNKGQDERTQSEDTPGEVKWTLEELLPGRKIRHWNGPARESAESRSLVVLETGRALSPMVWPR